MSLLSGNCRKIPKVRTGMTCHAEMSNRSAEKHGSDGDIKPSQKFIANATKSFDVAQGKHNFGIVKSVKRSDNPIHSRF